jgi:hypothetical protein
MLDDPDGFDRFLEIGQRLQRKRNKNDFFDVLDAAESAGMIPLSQNPQFTAWKMEEDEPEDQYESYNHGTNEAVGHRRA